MNVHFQLFTFNIWKGSSELDKGKMDCFHLKVKIIFMHFVLGEGGGRMKLKKEDFIKF